ncbi:MAG: hypothetical protein JXQ73_14040 [Phycisphaerae bacterium]|nr:hypothetical protein [Phycisphaerae bacterium]
MNDDDRMPNDDLLGRATRALREAPGDEVPPVELVERVVAKLEEEAALLVRGGFSERIRVMISKRNIAAAAAMVLIAGGLTAWLAPRRGTDGMAFAEVLERIGKARTLMYKQTLTIGEGEPVETQYMAMDPGRLRTVYPSGEVTILDMTQGKIVQLMPQIKQAFVQSNIAIGDRDSDVRDGARGDESREEGRSGRKVRSRFDSWINWIGTLHEQGGEFVRQESVDGQATRVYVARRKCETTTVWVDPKTNLPVRVAIVRVPDPDRPVPTTQFSFSSEEFGGEKTTVVVGVFAGEFGGETTGPNAAGESGDEDKAAIVMSDASQDKVTQTLYDFVWDVELDASLFSLTPPEGYTVHETEQDVSRPSEKDLVDALRFWAEMSDGAFPSEIGELGKARSKIVAKFNKEGPVNEEMDRAGRMALTIMKALDFVVERMARGSWHYAGDGVRLGESGTRVCWWRSGGADSYRVVYGDLTVKDAKAEDLPTTGGSSP